MNCAAAIALQEGVLAQTCPEDDGHHCRLRVGRTHPVPRGISRQRHRARCARSDGAQIGATVSVVGKHLLTIRADIPEGAVADIDVPRKCGRSVLVVAPAYA
jgi:hypothetical protein